MKYFATILFLAALCALASCRGAKLSVADEQFERGEYYDASVTYKKVYNICLNSLIESVKKIVESLETSNIGLYKFM